MNRTGIILTGVAGFLAIAATLIGAGKFDTKQRQAETGASETQAAARTQTGTGFDFYVLALSWSPSYCAREGKGADPQQCKLSKPKGFTVHGLWPQFETGFPADCAIGSPNNVDREILVRIKEVMPSASLARYQWRKHGTCSGLSQGDYFDTLRAAADAVRIPDIYHWPPSSVSVAPLKVEAAFLNANPGLHAAGFAAICDGTYLTEVRVCLTKDLAFRQCREVDRRACRARAVEMPPIQ